MLMITEATVIEVDRERFYFEKTNNLGGYTSFGTHEATLRIERELIEGTTFVNSRGERICLGLTSDVSKALRYPFELLDQNAREIHILNGNLSFERKRVKAFESMKLIQRLKFLFTGSLK